MRTGADEQIAPKYSHVERERRWLVDPAGLPTLPADFVLIEDRYIVGTRFRLRRMTDMATGEISLKLAKKYESADPTARAMVNAYLTSEEYAVFAALNARAVVKRRHLIDGFSVDQFDGALLGLILVEREVEDAADLAGIVPPSWIVREVTHDPRFQGGALAVLSPAESAALLEG